MQRTAVKMTRVLSMEYVINCFLFKEILAFKRLIYFLMCLLLLFCNDSYILTYPFSKSLWIWTVVFTEKLLPFPKSTLPISTFLSWMSTSESPMSTFSSFKSPLIWRFLLSETVSWVCILGAAPFAALGFVKYNGMTAEKFIWAWIKSEFLMPKKLVVHSTNTYNWQCHIVLCITKDLDKYVLLVNYLLHLLNFAVCDYKHYEYFQQNFLPNQGLS